VKKPAHQEAIERGSQNNPLKVEPPEWLPFLQALQRRRDSVGSGKLAMPDLLAWLRDGQLPSAVRLVNSSGQRVCARLSTKFWQEATFSGERDDFTEVRFHNRDPSFPWDAYIFVLADVFARLNTSASAPAPAPSKESHSAPRRQRPGPPTTHDWFAIWSEILRR
jgi:hypothetical protein